MHGSAENGLRNRGFGIRIGFSNDHTLDKVIATGFSTKWAEPVAEGGLGTWYYKKPDIPSEASYSPSTPNLYILFMNTLTMIPGHYGIWNEGDWFL